MHIPASNIACMECMKTIEQFDLTIVLHAVFFACINPAQHV